VEQIKSVAIGDWWRNAKWGRDVRDTLARASFCHLIEIKFDSLAMAVSLINPAILWLEFKIVDIYYTNYEYDDFLFAFIN